MLMIVVRIVTYGDDNHTIKVLIVSMVIATAGENRDARIGGAHRGDEGPDHDC